MGSSAINRQNTISALLVLDYFQNDLSMTSNAMSVTDTSVIYTGHALTLKLTR